MTIQIKAAESRTVPAQNPAKTGLTSAVIALALFFAGAPAARADYKDDVDYTALVAEFGAGIFTGDGVEVSQIEAAVQTNEGLAWMPNPINLEFSGKTITDKSGITPGVYSSHAAGVAKNFFGNTISTSPGITAINAYLADDWIGNGFLRITTGGYPIFQPAWTASRIGNHSWAGSAGTTAKDLDGLARLDWIIETDEMVHTTAAPLGKLLSAAYNVISVNSTANPTDGGSANVGGIYTSGRTKPDLVAPATSGSNAAPRVASAAALMIEAAHELLWWATDPSVISTTNRNGDTIYNQERVEVIKAALMAGADRTTSNSTSTDIIDYRIDPADQTVNGLDRRYGAGQLNIYNSFHIIAAGEQNSIEDYANTVGMIGSSGFDYDPAFGGSGSSNPTATYYFAQTTGTNRLTASLVWNLDINGGTASSFNGAATLYDLDLQLFDVTDPGNWIPVTSSASTNENTENLWLLLDSGKNYALRVLPGAGQAAFEWDCALAWRVVPVVVEPLEIDPITLPAPNQSVPYPPQTLTASGGQPPYTWSLASGSLPVGMTLSTGGVISGTPTGFGLSFFTTQVTDAAAATATHARSMNVKPMGYVCGACHSTTGL